LTLSACQTYQTVVIDSDPPGAQIFVNGAPIGDAPVSKSLLVDAAGVPMKDRVHQIEARKECFYTEKAVLKSDSNFWSNSKPYPEKMTLRLSADPRCQKAPTTRRAERPATPGPVATGSGFIISTDGLVVTNHHVIEGCSAVKVPPGLATVVASDPYFDLALLRTNRSVPAPAVFRAEGGVRPGDSVVVLGYPLRGLLSSEPNVSTGIVSSLSGPRNDSRVFQMSAPIQPGNSGGPVLDESGHVAGVSVGTLSTLGLAEAIGTIPQNVNFAIAAGSLQRFLREAGADYATEPSTVALGPAEIAARARQFTVLVECWN